ncbi:MAG: ribonuclease H-like domain-containing protein [Eubacteriales bacterium]
MYTVEKFYNDLPFKSKILDFYLQNTENKKLACLDIETTGLSPKNSKFILGALLEFKENGYLLKQYFAENLDEEKDILARYINEIEKIDILLTYNGKSFDIKYLKEKIKQYNIKPDFIFPLNIDIYLFLHSYSQFRKHLPNLKQKTVENFLGLWDKRSDMISGADSINRYYSYITSKDASLRAEILLHNSDDVLQLARIFPILEKTDLPRAFFNMECPLGFVISSEIKILPKILKIRGTSLKPISFEAYNIDDLPCHLSINKSDNNFSLDLPILQKNDMKIMNLKNINWDFTELEYYENYAQGYLLLKRDKTTYERSIIHALQLILKRISNMIDI